METKRSFKGVWIPKEIWLNKNLTLHEKLFFVEINSLDNDNGCFASNSHFSEFFGVSKGRCTQIIKSLETKNMISITIERDGKMISKRVIKILNTLFNKLNTPSEKTKHPYLENDEESNTSINNTIDNKLKNTKKENLLFPLKDLKQEEKKEKAAARKFLFANSKFSKYDEVRSYLAANQSYRERYAGADLKEYIHAVGTWSDKKNVMTTDRGWIAHIRSFMDRDKESGKLKMRPEKGNEKPRVLEPHEALRLGVHTNF